MPEIMPELPEVETVARTLAPLLTGEVIESLEVYWRRTLDHPNLDDARTAIVGRRIKNVSRRAKLVLIELDDDSLITVHLRMTGILLFRGANEQARAADREPYLRAVMRLTSGNELLFYDTRKFGRIRVVPAAERLALDMAYGMEPLSSTFTAGALAEILGARSRRIKPLLLDQGIIAGLGNIYVDESLFRSRIHPSQIARSIERQRVNALHRAIVDILSTAVDMRGTTIRDYRDAAGDAGANQSRLLVYGSKPGTPCPVCGSALERLVIAQRGSIYCPHCQSLPALSTPRR